MEKSFNNRTSVIYQNPQHPQNYKMVKRRWLMVPMCEYKVSVPYPKPNTLNLFQMTILKLLVSGSKEDEYIAKALCLNTELVSFIVDELEQRKLIDSRRRVTESGLKLVREGDESYDIKTGYVYYNYVTKTFMDAFVPDDKRMEVETGSRREGTISFDLGTIADREWHKATVVNVDTSANITPSPYDVLAICKRHNRRTRNFGFIEEESDEIVSMVDAESANGTSDISDLPWEIQSVKMLGSKKDVYVATYMFMAADDILNRSKLQVCYPFGEGTSSSLLDSIDKLSHKPDNISVRNEILGLKNDVFGMSDSELDAVRKGHSESEKKIKNILSDKIDNYPAVRDALLLVESSYLLVKELIDSNKGSNREIIKKNLDDYIVYNYNLLSSIFIYTAQKYDYFTDAELSNHVEQNSVVLKEFARKIGFSGIDNKAIDKFFRIKTRAVKEAVKASQHQLNALFAHNLVVADHFPEHPFYKLAKAIPNLIEYLSQLRDLRNDSSHANDIYQDFETVSSYRKKNMYIAYLLLDELSFDNYEEEFEKEQDNKSKEKLVKAMREAEITCESVYVSYFQRNTNIANQLRNLQFEALINGEYYPKRASEVFEAIFKQALSHRLNPESITMVKDSSKQEDRDELLDEIRNFGFNASEIPFYYKNRVMDTIRNYTQGSILTLFYAWYYSEKMREDSMLSELAARCPDFISLMISVHKNRGHSGKMKYTDKRLDFTKKTIDGAVNSMLELLFERGAL